MKADRTSVSKTPCSPLVATCLMLLVCLAALPAGASSHREAPFITEHPKVDATDFYMFRSYEPGRSGFVTLIANYVPLQDAYGGPNYFALDPEARYRINIENDGEPGEDLVFEFRFSNFLNNQAVPVGGQDVPVPLRQIGPIPGTPLNTPELYTVWVRRGNDVRRAINADIDSPFFAKALDYIGEKTFPNYDAYAATRMYSIGIPGCGNGRVFVGQRRESFAVNLGETFDLVNIENPVGPPIAEERSSTVDKNITSLALEVPIDCLTAGNGPVIGGWTTALLPRTRVLREDPSFDVPENTSDDFVQVSRLGMPLVNEVVIGMPDKDRFNASHPNDDLQFATYVTNPTLPELLEILFGVGAPNNFPRQDLLAAFVTGIEGVNAIGFGEMQRLNTAIPATAKGDQDYRGVLGGDNAGFPNGRRPGDDTVDITLRVAMGVLCHALPGTFGCGPGDAPTGDLLYTDQAYQAAAQFDNAFPYLTTPYPGSPNGDRIWRAILDGDNEVPPAINDFTGACGAVLTEAKDAIAISCTHNVVGATAAHIHIAPFDAAGPIGCNLGDPASPISFVCDAGNVDDLAMLVDRFEKGLTYVNIHSADFPASALRGQLE